MNLPDGARVAVIIRDDDTCALTPPALLRTVYGPVWEHGFPVTLGVTPRIVGSHNMNIPPALRGDGKEYPLTKQLPITHFLQELLQAGKIEVAQHGYRHTTNLGLKYPAFGKRKGYSRELLEQSSEFFGSPSASVQHDVAQGKRELEELFGEIRSFIAPQEYLTPALWEALLAAGIQGYSGGIKPQIWQNLPARHLSIGALARLIGARLRGVPHSSLGEYVAQLTPHLPIIPATYRHYWSGYDTPELAAATLAQAKALFKQKYDQGGGYFLLLTHYWEYFGDWQERVTQRQQLEGLHELTSYMNSFPAIWKCTLGQYVAAMDGAAPK